MNTVIKIQRLAALIGFTMAINLFILPIQASHADTRGENIAKIEKAFWEAGIAEKLQADGVTLEKFKANLSNLSDAQLERLASQLPANLSQVGGKSGMDYDHLAYSFVSIFVPIILLLLILYV